jgi:hypothetical protein
MLGESMSDRKTRLRETMEADHAACMAIFRRLTPEQWQQPVPSDEGAEWRARDVLAHVAVSEAGQLGQITRLLEGGVTVPDDFDLNRFNRRSVQKQAEAAEAELLAIIERDYAKVLSTMETVADGDLDKAGRHARGDTITVAQFFHRVTEHRRQHAEQVAEALGL